MKILQQNPLILYSLCLVTRLVTLTMFPKAKNIFIYVYIPSILVLVCGLGDFTEPGGNVIRNTTSYLVKHRKEALKPFFLGHGKQYHAKKLHGAISMAINTTELKNDLKNHVTKLNITINESFKVKLCNFTNQCNLYHNTILLFDKFQKLVDEIGSLVEYIEQYYNGRVERDPISFFMAMASLAGTAVNRLSIDRMQGHITSLESKVAKFSKIFGATNLLFKKMSAVIEQLRDRTRRLSSERKFEEMAMVTIHNLDKLNEHYSKVVSDMEGLWTGQFPTHLIKFSDVVHEFVDYESRVQNHALRPENTLPEIMQSPFHLMVFESVIHIIFDVALVSTDESDTFDIYQYINTPISYKNDLVTINTPSQLILFNPKTKYLTEVPDEFKTKCMHGKDPKSCGLVAKSEPITCLEHLFSYELKIENDLDIKRCHIAILDKSKPIAKIIQDHSMALYLPHIEVVTFTCSDGWNSYEAKSDTFRPGLYLIETRATCKIGIPGLITFLTNNDAIDAGLIERNINLQFGSYFENIVSDSKQKNISLPNRQLKELDEAITSLTDKTDRENHTYGTVGIGMGILLTFTILLASMTCFVGLRKLKVQKSHLIQLITGQMIRNSINQLSGVPAAPTQQN